MHNNQNMNVSQAQVASYKGLIGHSAIVENIKSMVDMVACHSTTVLLTGESGSGKEVVARQIHDASDRANKPFIPVNCGAIPAELLESEMFGHEKGAFTGAIATRKGRFEMAEGGTLFLDEIGDMSLPMQVKLLRVLQERKFDRVGSNHSMDCDVRIITATHRNLEQMIDEGTFRQDLYFRINVYPIELPALREHIEDIPELLDHLIAKMTMQGHDALHFSDQAITALGQSAWIGNIRELSNLIERLTITNPAGYIHLKDLPEKYRIGFDIGGDVIMESANNAQAELFTTKSPALDNANVPVLDVKNKALEDFTDLPEKGIDLKQHVANVERHYIDQALDKTGGVVSKAAQLLNMRRTTLVEKIRKIEATDAKLASSGTH
ncbi:MAG: sigma-54-dependent Fis family transcriptional regulator [Pseudomonadales bacterium]|nr:sigma-54-dependent Fis family transcriptional regulator [Pseudomonadales bacterium]